MKSLVIFYGYKLVKSSWTKNGSKFYRQLREYVPFYMTNKNSFPVLTFQINKYYFYKIHVFIEIWYFPNSCLIHVH